MTIYLGKVSCDLHKCASRVRVSIPGIDNISLSVKATLGGFKRNRFVKGLVVEVEQCKHDGRRFRVTTVYDPTVLKKPVEDAEAFGRQQCGDQNWKKDCTPLMSKEEKVRFYIGPKYFEHHEMEGILSRTLNVTPDECNRIARRGAGLTVIATTDQFARFLIDRNLNGVKNGFMDLNPKLIKPEPAPDAYQWLADSAGITRNQAKRVALALCYSGPQNIMDRVKPDPQMVDVSGR